MADRGMYEDLVNAPSCKEIKFKFFVDAGNQPTVPTAPLNLGISSIVWVSQGLYRITLMDAYKNHTSTTAQLNVNAAGQQRFVQPGPVANAGTSTAVTVDILVVDNAGAVQNPAAANANNFISGSITFIDVAAV
jgi:hypothetical protein